MARLFLVLLAITFVLRLPAFFVPVFNSDETFLATQAHVIEQGGQLYEDAADRKPPLVPYIYAATFAFFETSALWSVRVVAMLAVALTALLLAIEARRRYGTRAGWIAGVLFVLAMVAFAPQDGQAANFEVFMLPSMTAAILFARTRARRGRRSRRRGRDAREADRRGHVAARRVPARPCARKRGVGAVALGFSVPIAAVALAVGPSQLLYWAVLGNGSYLGVNTGSVIVIAMFVLMTLGVRRVQPATAVEAAERMARPSRTHARRRARHRPVAVAVLGRGVGRRSGFGSSVTTTCSWFRRSRCSPPGALARAVDGVQ